MLRAAPKHHDEYIQNNGAEPLEQNAKIGISKSGRRILFGLLLASPRGIVVQVVWIIGGDWLRSDAVRW